MPTTLYLSVGRSGEEPILAVTNNNSDLRSSVAEVVTNRLRRELLDGTIAAGSRVLPKDLAERFHVSIVPVREALRRLEAEGLVVTSPQRATYATEIGLEDLAGVYELRRVIEGEYVDRAAILATNVDHRACRDALADLLDAEPHSPAFFEAHRLFHWRLLEPAAKPVTRRFLERLWQSVDRYLALAARTSPEVSDASYMKAFRADHALLASAFEAGDGTRMRELLIEHLDTTETTLRRAYQDWAPDATAGPNGSLKDQG